MRSPTSSIAVGLHPNPLPLDPGIHLANSSLGSRMSSHIAIIGSGISEGERRPRRHGDWPQLAGNHIRPGYFLSPWPAPALKEIGPGSVGILGTSPSTIIVVDPAKPRNAATPAAPWMRQAASAGPASSAPTADRSSMPTLTRRRTSSS